MDRGDTGRGKIPGRVTSTLHPKPQSPNPKPEILNPRQLERLQGPGRTAEHLGQHAEANRQKHARSSHADDDLASNFAPSEGASVDLTGLGPDPLQYLDRQSRETECWAQNCRT